MLNFFMSPTIPSPEITIPPKPRSPGLFIGIVIGILLTTTIVYAFAYSDLYYRFVEPRHPPVPLPETSPIPDLPSETPPPPVSEKIEWLSSPIKISPLQIFLPSATKEPEKTNFSFKDTEFYQVAKLSNNEKLVYARIPYHGPSESGYLLRLVVGTGGGISLFSQWDENNSQDWFNSDIKPFLQPFQNSALNLPDLFPPATISSPQALYKRLWPTNKFFSEIEDQNQLKKVFDSEFGPVYQQNEVTSSFANVLTKKFYLRLKDNLIMPYSLSDSLLTDDQSAQVTWIINPHSTTFNQNIVLKCGGFLGVPFFKNENVPDSKTEIGRTYKGQPVYQIFDSNHPIVKAIYALYQTGREYPSAPPIISLTEFASKPNHFLWQDQQGDWQIFLSTDYSPAAECGKPVIYLYPEKATSVTVKVGADMSVSDPPYSQSGWAVLAKPSGELIYQNQSYPYLFWEGMGQGIYPDYQNRGVVVPQKDLIPTLTSHLKQLGLNQQESSDFMEFWQSKLPSTPYVRLTWLDTVDMNRLAPLSVSPRPDTAIRIFLEFEGLQTPRPLIPQTLSSPPRHGFTLIEWGGLLIKP